MFNACPMVPEELGNHFSNGVTTTRTLEKVSTVSITYFMRSTPAKTII